MIQPPVDTRGAQSYIARNSFPKGASEVHLRLVAKEETSAGSLYLAFQTPHAQRQLKALASVSVVDATFPADAESIILPPLSAILGQDIEACWSSFAEAEKIEDGVFEMIENHLNASWKT